MDNEFLNEAWLFHSSPRKEVGSLVRAIFFYRNGGCQVVGTELHMQWAVLKWKLKRNKTQIQTQAIRRVASRKCQPTLKTRIALFPHKYSVLFACFLIRLVTTIFLNPYSECGRERQGHFWIFLCRAVSMKLERMHGVYVELVQKYIILIIMAVESH